MFDDTGKHSRCVKFKRKSVKSQKKPNHKQHIPCWRITTTLARGKPVPWQLTLDRCMRT